MTDLELVLGDITEQHVDAIVNAANHSLLGGGGVDGAIHRAGGPQILAECRLLRARVYPDGLPTGKAVATTAGRLPARWVIHTVGPVFSTTIDRSEQLASAYRESVLVAARLGATSIAFPAISAGIYGWPLASAAEIAIDSVRGAIADGSAGPLELVRFVLFG
ncbi:MAG TPA: O-acetyl-ADP-ribose deacetylase, partial [Microbacteriaceae bacterium]|nr:O-acetyl-ADP-ribose deacetylase [Microbacteriaceae bacterium]